MPRAILFDCLGTLLRLEPPAPRLAARLGVAPEAAEAAIRAEIAHYRANLQRASDAASLATLRAECAQVVADHLGRPCSVDDLLACIVFTPFEDTVPALTALRPLRLVVVSNWDVSLHEVLDRTGLTPLLDGAVSSAEVGAAKPDPRPVLAALGDIAPADAWLIGDSPEDVGAAEAAGVRPFLIDRNGGPGALRSLLDLPSMAR